MHLCPGPPPVPATSTIAPTADAMSTNKFDALGSDDRLHLHLHLPLHLHLVRARVRGARRC